MKRVIVFLSVFAFVSCNKDFTCTCTSDTNGSVTNISEYNLTKSDAESACDNADSEEGVSCELEKV